jgi:hypothetical protein
LLEKKSVLRATPLSYKRGKAAKTQNCSPFFSLGEEREKRDQRDLGTTLGRACSRWCRERRVRSKIGWLAGSRDSHHVSRFAAFFILARAEISVDGSCFGVSRFFFFFVSQKNKKTKVQRFFNAFFPLSSLFFWPSSFFLSRFF